MAILRVTHKLTIHPNIYVRRSRTDVKLDVAATPTLGQGELTTIRANVVLLDGHIGRIVAEVTAPRITYIHIYGVTIAVELPHRRHLHTIPTLVVVTNREKVGRTLVGILHPVELPRSVEREAVGVLLIAISTLSLGHILEDLVGRVHLLAVDLIYVGIAPLRESLRLYARQGRKCSKQ